MTDETRASAENDTGAADSEGPSRRTFIKVMGVAGVGLTLGISYKVLAGGPKELYTDAAFAPNAFLRIDEQGSVTIVVGKSEMGQGVATALPQLIAEELEVPLDRVTFAFAPAHPAYRDGMGMQMTGGSTSIATAWQPLREAGATARMLLQEAAAQRWGVPAHEVEMRGGEALHSDGSQLSYGDLARSAALMPMPETVTLKEPSDFRLIGTSPPRLDIVPKTRGEATFGIDAGPPDAHVAVIARSPVFGGTLRRFDATAALAESGVAVVADGYWAASAGRAALEIEWDEGAGATLDDAEILLRFQAAVAAGGQAAREDGDTAAALGASAKSVSAAYTLPYLAHATMEPMNCTAIVDQGKCTVWAPTQFQDAPGMIGGGGRQAAAKAAGLDEDDVDLHTTFLGGGFGRRAEKDFVIEAAELASKVEGAVKVVWSREDDIRHDFYRPASYHELEVGLDDQGYPVAWRHEMASQSILDRWLPQWLPKFVLDWAGMLPNGVDPTAVEGAGNHPYSVPNAHVAWSNVELPIPIGFWRSVGNSHNGFVIESFIDELAHASGHDPFEYRRTLLAEHPRHKAVLEAVAEAADWGAPVKDGRARGIAVVESFGSFVAQVAEVSLDSGRPRVHHVWCAVDCGVVVNPAIIQAQIESAIMYGLTAALYGRISIRGGKAVQSNFHDYPMLRMNEAPSVDVVLVPSGDAPGGIGEPGLPPIAPAVTNALFALTGQRIRELPIQLA